MGNFEWKFLLEIEKQTVRPTAQLWRGPIALGADLKGTNY